MIDTDALPERDGESIRLIDANAINYDDYWWNKGYSARDCQQAAKLIDEQPIVDAVPVVHGRWIDEGQYADYHPHHAWRCSECGEHVIEIDTPWYKYCPNCGADMRGEQDG